MDNHDVWCGRLRRCWMVVVVLLLLNCFGVVAGGYTAEDQKQLSRFQEKLKTIVIDEIECEETPLTDVLRTVVRKAKEADPERKGVNLVVYLPEPDTVEDGQNDDDWGEDWGDVDEDDEDDEDAAGNAPTSGIPTVTMVIHDVPVGRVLHYICQAANLQYRIEPYAFVIKPFAHANCGYGTKLYPVDESAVLALGRGKVDNEALKAYFEEHGVKFEQSRGQSILYDPLINRVVATHEEVQLAEISELVKALSSPKPQVMVTARWFRVGEAEYNSFPWAGDRVPKDRKLSGDKLDTILQADTCVLIASAAAMVGSARGTSLELVNETRPITAYQEAEFKYPGKGTDAEHAGVTLKKDSPPFGIFFPAFPVFGKPEKAGVLLNVKAGVAPDNYTIDLTLNLDLVTRTKRATEAGDAMSSEDGTRVFGAASRYTLYDGESLLLQSNEDGDFRDLLLVTARLVNPDGSSVRRLKKDPPAKKETRQRDIVRQKNAETNIPRKKSALQRKLDKRVTVDFHATDLVTVIKKLAELSDVELYLKTSALALDEAPTITMTLVDTPVREVVRYLAFLVGIDYRIEPNGVVFGNTSLSPVDTRLYRIAPEIIQGILGKKTDDKGEESRMLREYFSNRGVPCPDGTNASYNWGTGQLTVRGEPKALTRLEELLACLTRTMPMVSVRVKVVLLTREEENALGLGRDDTGYFPATAVEKLWGATPGIVLAETAVLAGDCVGASGGQRSEFGLPVNWERPRVFLFNNTEIPVKSVPVLGTTKRTGFALSVTPKIAYDNFRVSLQVSASLARLTGWQSFTYSLSTKKGEDRKLAEYQIRIPEVSCLNLQGQINVFDGTPVVIGRVRSRRLQRGRGGLSVSGESRLSDPVSTIFLLGSARLVDAEGNYIRSKRK